LCRQVTVAATTNSPLRRRKVVAQPGQTLAVAPAITKLIAPVRRNRTTARRLPLIAGRLDADRGPLARSDNRKGGLKFFDQVSVQLLLAGGAFAAAAIGLYFTWWAHRERVDREQAGARFEVTIRTVDADENGIRWTDADTQHTRIGVGVKNVGEREAGETLVNVVVPRSLEFARWAGPGGEESPDGKLTAETPELLPDAKGNETIPSKFLSSTWPRVGLRPHYEKFAQFPVELPPRDSARQTTVPIRVRVQADELPDDIEEYVVDYTVHVVRRG
jgi:hypothetical protein